MYFIKEIDMWNRWNTPTPQPDYFGSRSVEGFPGYKQALDLVNSPKFPGWQEGMVAVNSNRSTTLQPYGRDPETLPGGLVPDLDHPTTIGWFTQWLRDIHRDIEMITAGGQTHIIADHEELAVADSPGMALLMALLRCYGRKPTKTGWWWLRMENGAPWAPLHVWQEDSSGQFYYRDPEGEPLPVAGLPPTVMWGSNVEGPA
jgi:hypothetical protein